MNDFVPLRNSKMLLNEVYFWTSSIHKHQSLLTSPFKEVIIQSLAYLSSKNKIKVYGFVLMPNHIHLLWEMIALNGKEMLYASFQKYTAHSFQTLLRKQNSSLLKDYHVDSVERRYRFWQRDPLAILVTSKHMFEQKLDYIHTNPLQEHWSLCNNPEDYHYSSSSFYEQSLSTFTFLNHYMDRF